MIASTVGIFSGGHVTLDVQASAIRIGPTILRSASGENVGFGGPGRVISVHFGTSSFGFSASFPSDLEAPIYALYLDGTAGQAFICYDHGTERDIVVSRTVSPSMTVLAKAQWPAGASTVNDISLDFSERAETRLIEADDPISAMDLYHSGMDFSDISFNKPLISMSILSQVLQGELSARSGDNFSVVLAKRQDIVALASSVLVKPVRIMMRSLVDGVVRYRLLDTKTDFTFPLSGPMATYHGKVIHVYVDPDTGIPGCGVSQPPDTVLVARGLVRDFYNSLAEVRYEIASEINQSNAQTGSQQKIYRESIATGFVGEVPISISEDGVNISLGESTVIANGVYCSVFPSSVPIGPMDQVTSGCQFDLVYLEVSQYISGSPPTDGQAFIPLSGIGYVVAEAHLKLARGLDPMNVCLGMPENLMLDEKVTSRSGANFTYTPDDNWNFTGVDTDVNSYSGQTYGIPLALVSRFNSAPWGATNPAGGGLVDGKPSRPDGKRHDQVHADELWVISPQASVKGVNHEQVMQKALQAILKGGVLFGVAHQIPYFISRMPTQVDYISEVPNNSSLFTHVGSQDGKRLEFSALPEPYRIGQIFKLNVDTDGKVFSLVDRGVPSDYTNVSVFAPEGALLSLSEGGQPRVTLTDQLTGEAIATKSGWNVGFDSRGADAEIPSRYIGNICGSVEIIHNGHESLSFSPKKIHQCSIDSNLVDYVDLSHPRIETKINGNKYEWAFEKDRAESARVEISYVGENSNRITLSKAKSDGRNVIGVLHAKRIDTNGNTKILGLHSARLSADNKTVEEVILQEPIPQGTTVYLTCALEGIRVVLDGKQSGIVRTDHSLVWDGGLWGSPGATLDTIHIPLTTNPDFDMPLLLSGAKFLSTEKKDSVFDVANKTAIYIDGFLYPATLKSIGHTQVTVQIALTQAEYDVSALAGAATADNWIKGADNLYRLIGSHYIRLPICVARPLRRSETLRLVYGYHPQPFFQMTNQDEMRIAHPGKILASNSSPSNKWQHPYAPLSERLPVVSGPSANRIAPSASDVSLTMVDSLEVGQDKEPPFSGEELVLDGRFKFHAGVFDKDSGYVAWLCLAKKERWLRVFCYLNKDDGMLVKDPGMAFVCTPPGTPVE